jgi:hypothetical protein
MDSKMNERIKELAIQAGFFYEDYKDIWYLEYHNETCEEEMKKFAELIVRECARVAIEKQTENDIANIVSENPAKDFAYALIEHFGVEQ